MGMKANSGLFTGTKGYLRFKLDIQMFATKKSDGAFSSRGHITDKSVSEFREQFIGKSIGQIAEDMKKYGYEAIIGKSKHPGSKAKIIVVKNSDKHKNITQVQVSPGSTRHGNVPYVKFSLNNPVGAKQYAKIKVIDAKKTDYKSDGKEKTYVFFRRKQK